MTDEFEYEEIAKGVLTQHGQDEGFAQGFRAFCKNAMRGNAEETDLLELIERVELPEEEWTDES